ncbi:MAG: dephospho-CoA kinase [Armatimonadetes bacterium]|nr:dephospho-CoA kinase [Armatimonadota bacterium]
MRILGLTGDIACGKSSVARLLAAKGAAILDADLLVRELYADPDFASQVAALFAAPVRNENGEIDRARLGALVFEDEEKLRRLERLVHPAVAALRSEKLRALEAAGAEVVAVEAVKLLESGQGANCDEIWCVVCAPEVQLRRLMENRGLSESEARARLQNQPTREAKIALARPTPLWWIENNGTMDELAAQVARHWTRFLA